MEVSWRSKCIKWVLRLSFALLALLSVSLAGLYFARVTISNYIVSEVLSDLGFDGSGIEITSLTKESLSARNLVFVTDSMRVEVGQIDVGFRISDIQENYRVEEVSLERVAIRYDLRGPSTLDMEELDSQIKSGFPIPFRALSLESVEWELLTDAGPLRFDGALALAVSDENELNGTLQMESDIEKLNLDIRMNDRIRYDAKIEIARIDDSLARLDYAIEDFAPLPSDARVEFSGGTVQVEGTFFGISPENATVSVQLDSVDYADTDGAASIQLVDASTNYANGKIEDTRIEFTLEALRKGPLALQTPARVTLESPTLRAVSASIPELEWSLDSGESGSLFARLEAQIDDAYELQRFTARIESNELAASGHELAPFTIQAKGTSDSLQLEFSPLSSRSVPSIRLEELSLSITEFLENGPRIEYAAQLHSKPASPNSDSDLPITGSWQLNGACDTAAAPMTAQLNLSSVSGTSVAAFEGSSIEGNASASIDARYWLEDQAIGLTLELTGAELTSESQQWKLGGGALEVNASLSSAQLSTLVEANENPGELLSYLAPRTRYNISLQGSELSLPDTASLNWISGSLQSVDTEIGDFISQPLNSVLQFGVGIVRVGSEEIQQLAVESSLSGGLDSLVAQTTGQLLFEGETVSIESRQALDFLETGMQSNGEYKVSGIRLVNSDLLSRHVESLTGSVLSGEIGFGGKLELADRWDASVAAQLRQGSLVLPYQDLTVDAIESDFELASIASQTTPGAQSIKAGKVALGDLTAVDFLAKIALPRSGQLAVEHAQLSTFDGLVSIDPFAFELEKPDAKMVVRFDGISIAPAIAMLDFFDGEVQGRLNGSLPINLENGYPVLGEGYLELDPSTEATFSYNARGYFTGEDEAVPSKKTLGDKLLEKLGLEPNALLEDALGDLDIQDMRLDLFSRDLPETPMRIQMSGTANAGETEIPLHITTNVNGTVAELLNFLTRLDSLGVAAANQISNR